MLLGESPCGFESRHQHRRLPRACSPPNFELRARLLQPVSLHRESRGVLILSAFVFVSAHPSFWTNLDSATMTDHVLSYLRGLRVAAFATPRRAGERYALRLFTYHPPTAGRVCRADRANSRRRPRRVWGILHAGRDDRLDELRD